MAHRSALGGVVIDCRTDDLEGAAAFWAAALGMTAGPVEGAYVGLSGGSGPGVVVQKVAHASRVHLDIAADDIPAEVARLERLGASKVAEVETWTVMEAPTGHRFCVVGGLPDGFEATARTWED